MKKTTTAIERCKTVSTIQKILGGKWKLEIIYYIAFADIHRFGALRRQIGEITESSLTKQLRELEADGFLSRHDYQEVPPRVEYNLTDLGKSFLPVFEHMKQWGEEHLLCPAKSVICTTKKQEWSLSTANTPRTPTRCTIMFP